MSLRFCDSFDGYVGTSTIPLIHNQIGYKWGVAPANITGQYTLIYAPTGGRFGQGALQVNLTILATASLIKLDGWNTTANVENYIGFWFRRGVTAGTFAEGVVFANRLAMSSSIQTGINYLLSYTSTGALALTQLGSPSTVLASGIKTVNDDRWHWIEFRWKGATDATGAATLYIDNELQFNYNGTTIAAGTVFDGAVGVAFRGITNSGTTTFLIDDVILWDSTGTDFNSFPIGPKQIDMRKPTGPGASTQFTPSSGSNWSAVNSNYASTNYVYTKQSAQTDLYQMSTLGPRVVGISAIVTNIYTIGRGVTDTVAPTIRDTQTANGSATGVGIRGTTAQFIRYKNSDGTPLTSVSINNSQAGMTSV